MLRCNDKTMKRQSETEYLKSIPGMVDSLLSGIDSPDSEYSKVVDWEPEYCGVTDCEPQIHMNSIVVWSTISEQ